MIVNDKTIFECLKPFDNEMLTKINKSDKEYLLSCLDKYYLEYRNSLNLDGDKTFGIEIEFENYTGWYALGYNNFKRKLDSVICSDKWKVVNDWSLRNGGEIVSEILTDTNENWEKIRRACEFISSLGEIGVNCASHVHAGSQILGENPLYWKRLFKLWSVYENIIYRFSYGESFVGRPKIMQFSRPAALFYLESLKKIDNKENYNVLEMLWGIEPFSSDDRYTKNFGLSYWRMLADDDYNVYSDFNQNNEGCTLEYRVPNGTFNEIIWQNNINLFIKMMLYCKSIKYDEDIINKRMLEVEDNCSVLMSYSFLYLEQAIEFVDMIFDNNLDKIYFLKQYIKDISEEERSFFKTKKLTMSERR